MLKDIYNKIFGKRRPKIGKFELDQVFESVVMKIADDDILDLVQVMAWELLLLRDRSNRMSQRIIELTEHANNALAPDFEKARRKNRTNN